MVTLITSKSLFAQASPTINTRIGSRTFPSVFQAWNKATNLGDEPELVTAARHDLIFHSPSFFHLHWQEKPNAEFATSLTTESLTRGPMLRRELLKLNPNLVLICEIRYRDAHRSYLPDDHPWWLRDEQGKRIIGWEEGNYYNLDYHNPDYRKAVVARASAAVQSGAVDGVMLDWWAEDDSRVALAQEMRNAIGDEALILVNANDRTAPRTAEYVNGLFMECYRSQTAEDWQRIANTLTWAEKHLRAPRINCVETWYHRSRKDLNLMRAVTTLGLTHTDGYVLFSDPNDLASGDHLHDWYPFWEAKLGKPTGKRIDNADGSFTRSFEKGIAVYNPMGNQTVTVECETAHRSMATGSIGRSHRLAAPDGDILIRIE